MAGRRRGRTGRGWDAAPPRARRGPTRAQPPAGDPGADAPSPSDDPVSTDDTASAGDPPARAREICLRLLAVRPRTHEELASALRRHGIPDEVAAEVLDRYRDVGMVDDAAFARAWVSSRHHGKGLAGRALGRELRRRGVDPETVGEALETLDPATELATARELVARKLAGTRGDPATVVRRLVGMLARKGYPPGLAFRVVKEALDADERTAALAEQLDPDALADAEADQEA